MNDYNGWSNYETWNVKLWIDNDQGLQEHYTERAQHHTDQELADIIESDHQARLEELSEVQGTFLDLLTTSLARVNWLEIAEALAE